MPSGDAAAAARDGACESSGSPIRQKRPREGSSDEGTDYGDEDGACSDATVDGVVSCSKCGKDHRTDQCPDYLEDRGVHEDAQPNSAAKEAGPEPDTPPLTLPPGAAKGVRQPRDGTCLFHSLAYGLAKTVKGGAKLRTKLLKWMADNADKIISGKTWAERVEKIMVHDAQASATQRYTHTRSSKRTRSVAEGGATEVEKYCKKMQSPREYGGQLEIIAFQQSEKVSVWSYKALDDGSYHRTGVVGSPGGEGKVVHIVYDGTHYDALEVDEDQLRKALSGDDGSGGGSGGGGEDGDDSEAGGSGGASGGGGSDGGPGSGAGKPNGGKGKRKRGSDGASGGGGPRQTRSAGGSSSSTDARDQFIRYGEGYTGPSIGNGRVVIKQSTRGGKLGRGLFVGPGGLKAKQKSDRVLYSGERIDGKEAKAREARCNGDYLLQLHPRDDGDRVDGKVFADAISKEPDADGNYTVLPGEEWALDAGPGPIANEDEQRPNATFHTEYFDGRQCLQTYRVIRPLQDLEEGAEILLKYNRKGTVGDGGHASVRAPP